MRKKKLVGKWEYHEGTTYNLKEIRKNKEYINKHDKFDNDIYYWEYYPKDNIFQIMLRDGTYYRNYTIIEVSENELTIQGRNKKYITYTKYE